MYIGALEIEADDRQVAHVTKSGKLVPAGRGKITIDSGAAESVMPNGLLPKRHGVKYVAANGARMENLGEKKAKLKRIGSDEVNGVTF